MEVYKRLFYFLLHSFIECPDEDLEWFKNAKGVCKKCGREFLGLVCKEREVNNTYVL